MSADRPNYHNHLYLGLLLAGILLSVICVWSANTKISNFESNTNRIHRMITTVEIDLRTLEREIDSITQTLKELQAELDANPSEQTRAEITRLNDSILKLRSDIAEKQKLIISLDLLRAGNMTQVKTLFWITSLLQTVGLLMIISGAVALGVKLEYFADRRKKQREESI